MQINTQKLAYTTEGEISMDKTDENWLRTKYMKTTITIDTFGALDRLQNLCVTQSLSGGKELNAK